MFTIYGSIKSLAESDTLQTERSLVVDSCGHFSLVPGEKQHVFRPNGRRDYQIIYIKSGRGYYTIQGSTRMLEAGHVILYHPDEPQFYHYRGEDKPDIYWIHFVGTRVMEILQELNMSSQRVYSVKIGEEHRHAFEDILRELQLKRRYYSELADAKFLQILYCISREVLEQLGTAIPRTEDVEKAVEVFHMWFNSPLSIKEYAQSCNMSPCWFTRRFRKQMGVTPQQYIIDIRIAHACEMLASGSSVAEAGEMAGYEDALYFSRIFKKQTGHTPSEYRKTIRASL